MVGMKLAIGLVVAVATSAWAEGPEFLKASLLKTASKRSAIQAEVATKVKAAAKKQEKTSHPLSESDQARLVAALTDYLAFMGVDTAEPDEEGTTAGKLAGTILSRLSNSSTQFLLCDDVTDWECLEKTPLLTPVSDYRQETSDDLGRPRDAGASLSIETFFSNGWNSFDPNLSKRPRTVAAKLAEKITKEATGSLHVAWYGIDDIEGSMKPVYDAVIAAANRPGSEVKGVFDAMTESDPDNFLRAYDAVISSGRIEVMPAKRPIIFSYVKPTSSADLEYWAYSRPKWMTELYELGRKIAESKGTYPEIVASTAGMNKELHDAEWLLKAYGRGGASRVSAEKAVRMGFQYKGTRAFLNELNEGIKRDEDSIARLEWPADNIMHNKFAVMESKSGSKSVWTGTSNVAATCMGNEDNSNMSLFFKNDEIAEAFDEEFQEMFGFNDVEPYKMGKVKLVDQHGGTSIQRGRFHFDKRPNTHRYFRFKDGTELRVHFSPTDDGEHRAILPMLLSARAGDQIRVSMFGGAGLELVRAFQYAAAKGANIKIVVDTTTGSQPTAWTKSKLGKVTDPNPFAQLVDRGGAPLGKIEVRKEGWRGLNHQKIGLLSRKAGTVFRDEVLIVGSQNWTTQGNDKNDENMVTIRNAKSGLPAGSAFRKHFDEEIWPVAAKPAGGGSSPSGGETLPEGVTSIETQ